MKFGPVRIDQAFGKILGHNIAGKDGRRILRKGRPISSVDIQILENLGRKIVYVADMEPGDVGENEAAERIAAAIGGPGLEVSDPSAGRVNLAGQFSGVLRVDIARLDQINSFEGATTATLKTHQVVRPRQIAATVKIIPYAIPENTLLEIEALCQLSEPLISLAPLPETRVGLILMGAGQFENRLQVSFEPPLQERVAALGGQIIETQFVRLEEDEGEVDLADLLNDLGARELDLIILAGDTAIMDRQDIAPRAVQRAGGLVECVGVPVDPGNLLMLAYLGERPILGAPGCARSSKTNVIDWVLPRLLVGERLRRADLVGLGHGGLLEDTPLRPRPRRSG